MGFTSIEWPSYSPDLNIIENIWSLIQDKLYDMKADLHNPDEVWEYTQEIWNGLNSTFIKNLYRSLPFRMEQVLKNNGGPIDY